MRILSFVWVNSKTVIKKKLALKLNFLFDENTAIMNLDNMHWSAAENARKCAQKVFGQKWTKCLFSHCTSFLVFFCCICVKDWKTLWI